MEKPTLTIFISSPGDVAEERALSARVLDRLQSEFAHRTLLEPIFWEHEPLRATESFQDGLPLPSQADIVISILWTRLGTWLPAHYKKADGGKLPPTGTEFELQDAKAAFLEKGSPDLLVYRKTDEPLVSIKDKNALRQRLDQMEALDDFIQHFFYDDEGAFKGAFHTFIQKRLFVSDMDGTGVATVSLSHEILLRTWQVLKDHINADMKFLSSRSKIERFHQTWLDEGASEGYLLPEGNLLAEALELLDERGAEISTGLQRYIGASRQRAKARQKRKTRILASVFPIPDKVIYRCGLEIWVGQPENIKKP